MIAFLLPPKRNKPRERHGIRAPNMPGKTNPVKNLARFILDYCAAVPWHSVCSWTFQNMNNLKAWCRHLTWAIPYTTRGVWDLGLEAEDGTGIGTAMVSGGLPWIRGWTSGKVKKETGKSTWMKAKKLKDVDCRWAVSPSPPTITAVGYCKLKNMLKPLKPCQKHGIKPKNQFWDLP